MTERAARVIHRFTLLAWIAGIVHTLGEGTDAHEPWFLGLLAATTLPAVVALGWRVSERGVTRPQGSVARA